MYVTDLGDRLGYCVTFLLADVATLQLLFDQLPNIPYLTFLDLYTYICFLFLFAITIWSCLTASERLANFDHFAFYVASCLFVFLHIYFTSLADWLTKCKTAN